jgi:hypothetical protein
MERDLRTLIADIKSLCTDRLEAKTADGYVLADVFDMADKLAAKEEKKKA